MSTPDQSTEQTTGTPVRVEVTGGVLVATIDRPRAKNSVDAATARALADALDRLEDDPDLRVGVLTGAGGTFCAGMDLKAFARGESPVVGDRGFAGVTRSRRTKPLVAAVEGWALGGGTELALACDLVVAAADARFGLPEVTRGIVAPEGGMLRLPKALPRAVAAELLLTGEPLPAERAERYGLLTRLTPPGEALVAALDLAHRIAAGAPLAVRAVTRVLHEALDVEESEGFRRQDALVREVLTSSDAAEGARAFAERRAPVWTGR
ncbi:crotonase/enoyl-CoA hydratase family protein [Kineococcus sp. DHX-1]|uniref:crotonase/enoyl-CoA hydratase family protein n=1 Tax=Kineococcus sp. DHX-1 TaxID=3349638 RepID=UPI0036D3523A